MNAFQPKIILTRYLYLKDEVEIALLMSILNKDDCALFWTFELYFSGFETDLWNLFWKIYYEFYATLNPTMESFILKKHTDFLSKDSDEDKEKIIATITNNLLIRKYTLDVFMLQQIVKQFEIEPAHSKETIDTLLKKGNYEQMACFIFENSRVDTLAKIIDYFISKKIPLKKNKIIKDFEKMPFATKWTIMLSKMMHYFHLMNGSKMGKSWYVYVESENLKQYATIYNIELDSRNILEKVCLFGGDDSGYLGAFKLKRDSVTNVKMEYRFHWLYYAAFSPVWRSRIEKFGGLLNNETKKIDFANDELFDAFYDEFQYDSDEQSAEVHEKNIPSIHDRSPQKMKKLCNLYDIYKIDESYWDEMDTFYL